MRHYYKDCTDYRELHSRYEARTRSRAWALIGACIVGLGVMIAVPMCEERQTIDGLISGDVSQFYKDGKCWVPGMEMLQNY